MKTIEIQLTEAEYEDYLTGKKIMSRAFGCEITDNQFLLSAVYNYVRIARDIEEKGLL